MNILLQLIWGFVRESTTKRGILCGSNHSYSDRCQAGRKGATQLYQKWKAVLCCPLLRQPGHKMRRTLPVLRQGFCVSCAVNCICFKVLDVSQGENGQVGSPNAHINAESGSPESSPQAGGPPSRRLPLPLTESLTEDSRTDHNFETAAENPACFQKPLADIHLWWICILSYRARTAAG